MQPQDYQPRRPGRPKKNFEDKLKQNVTQVVKQEPIQLPDWDGKIRGPTLGQFTPDEREWHPLTLKWWRAWRKSPQAMFMMETDWEGLFLGALIHDRIMKGVSSTALANLDSGLRRREATVGSTIEDRIRLGMISDSGKKEAQEAQIENAVAEAVDYAKLIGDRLAQDGHT